MKKLILVTCLLIFVGSAATARAEAPSSATAICQWLVSENLLSDLQAPVNLTLFDKQTHNGATTYKLSALGSCVPGQEEITLKEMTGDDQDNPQWGSAKFTTDFQISFDATKTVENFIYNGDYKFYYVARTTYDHHATRTTPIVDVKCLPTPGSITIQLFGMGKVSRSVTGDTPDQYDYSLPNFTTTLFITTSNLMTISTDSSKPFYDFGGSRVHQ